MNEFLTMADGTKVENAHILQMTPDSIIVYADNGMSFKAGYNLFSKPAKTQTIRENRYGQETTLEGYTELYALRKESATLLTACLRKATENA